MKNTIKSTFVLALLVLPFAYSLNAQTAENTGQIKEEYHLSKGLKFNLNNGAYQFGIGGLIQPSIQLNRDTAGANKFGLNSYRTFFNLSGKALKEKVSFFVQTDFNLTSPLMDAWVAYQAAPFLKITLGQQLTFANNREMALTEGNLQFLNRSLLSRQYANTGREFGLYVNANFKIKNMVFEPGIAITSGDGRNSFGASPTDFDLGGFKYAGRLDWYPFGKFSDPNNLLVADITAEEKFKLVLGAAASVNRGVSDMHGEGHGNFLMYNPQGKLQLPDYRKLYFDALAKYKGFSLLGEYVVATGKVSQGTFRDVTGLNRLNPGEISEFLALGSGINTQLGYVFKKSIGVDMRYAFVSGEFANNAKSLVEQKSELALGLTKYINKNNLKINTSIAQINTSTNSTLFASFWVQLMF